jgi:hypothetical protein
MGVGQPLSLDGYARAIDDPFVINLARRTRHRGCARSHVHQARTRRRDLARHRRQGLLGL